MAKVAAVVVTYNRIELLQQCVTALQKQSSTCDVLIIDNASTDGTEDWVAELMVKHSQVHYRNTGNNLGGAGGFNLGLRWALEAGYDYLWVMDDDCFPNEDALEELLKADAKLGADYGFQCSRVLWTDGSLAQMNLPRQTVYRDARATQEQLVPIAMASFVSLFLRAHVVRQVGLPIKEFFIWTDDWEYTRRISRSYKCYWNTKSIVVHHSKRNEGAKLATAPIELLPRFYYLYRNDVYLYRREGLAGFAYEVVRLNWHMLQVCLHGNHKLARLKILLQGTGAGLSFNPKIEYVE